MKFAALEISTWRTKAYRWLPVYFGCLQTHRNIVDSSNVKGNGFASSEVDPVIWLFRTFGDDSEKARHITGNRDGTDRSHTRQASMPLPAAPNFGHLHQKCGRAEIPGPPHPNMPLNASPCRYITFCEVLATLGSLMPNVPQTRLTATFHSVF